MAIDDEDLELDEEKAGAKKKSGSGLVKIIIIVSVVVVVVAISIVGTMFATGAFSDKSSGEGENTKVATAKAKKPGNHSEVFYESLNPPFVVNFQDKNLVRFLQVGIDIMAMNQEGIDNAKKHMPVIRNDIVLILGDVKYADINSRDGKEKLRKKILADVRKILKERTGDESVADLFFTSFVMQ
jgi:flagellar FliL protein